MFEEYPEILNVDEACEILRCGRNNLYALLTSDNEKTRLRAYRNARDLNNYFARHPPNLGNAESILDAMFWAYAESNPVNNDTIRKDYAKLREAWKLPPQEYDEILYIISDLCTEHGRLAFQDGIRVGMLVMQEVNHSYGLFLHNVVI